MAVYSCVKTKNKLPLHLVFWADGGVALEKIMFRKLLHFPSIIRHQQFLEVVILLLG